MLGLFDEQIGRLQNDAANTTEFVAMFIKILIVCLRYPWLFIVIPLLPWILLSQDLPTLVLGVIFVAGGWRLHAHGY